MKLRNLSSLEFIALRQKTRLAVVPVRSMGEMKLVKELMASHKVARKAIDFNSLTISFNTSSLMNGQDYCFKVPELLCNYAAKGWSRARNRDLALANAGPDRQQLSNNLLKNIVNPPGISNVPKLLESVMPPKPAGRSIHLPTITPAPVSIISQSISSNSAIDDVSNSRIHSTGSSSQTVTDISNTITTSNFRQPFLWQTPGILNQPSTLHNPNLNLVFSYHNNLINNHTPMNAAPSNIHTVPSNNRTAAYMRTLDLHLLHPPSTTNTDVRYRFAKHKNPRKCGICLMTECPGRGGRKICWKWKEENGEDLSEKGLALKRLYSQINR